MSKDGLEMRGIFRIQLEEDGKIVGDSGWHDNVIVNRGKKDYVLGAMAAAANSSQVSHVAIGTGTEPGAAADSLDGEIGHASNSRKAVSTSSNGSTRMDFLATFASSDNHITASVAASNIGLFATSTTQVGTLMAGNTYTSSQWNTNQNLNVTYTITV